MERKADFKPSVLWVGGDAFVQIIDANLKGTISDLTLELKAVNKLNSNLTKIEYEVIFYDSGEMRIIEDPYQVVGEDINIEPEKIGIASRLNIGKKFPNTRRVEIKILKAHFSDGNSIDLIYENMEKFALQKLKEEELSILKKVAGEDVIGLPAKLTSNWRCVCGYFNGDESEFCNNCMRSKTQIFTDYKSIEHINEVIEREIKGEFDILSNSKDVFEKFDEEDEEPIDQELLMKELLEEQKKYAQKPIEVDKDIDKDVEEVNIKSEILQFLSKFPKLNLLMFLVSGVMISSSMFIFLFRKF